MDSLITSKKHSVCLDRNLLKEWEGKEEISSNLPLFGLIDLMRESKSRDDCDPFNSLQILCFSSFQIGGIWKEWLIIQIMRECQVSLPSLFFFFLSFPFPYKYNPNILLSFILGLLAFYYPTANHTASLVL